MTAAPGGRLAAEDPDDAGCPHELRLELAGRGIAIDDPAERTPLRFLNLRGGWCEINLRDTGALTWTYLPQRRDLSLAQAVRLALALRAGAGLPGPAAPGQDPGLPLKDAAGRVLEACGSAAAANSCENVVSPALPVPSWVFTPPASPRPSLRHSQAQRERASPNKHLRRAQGRPAQGGSCPAHPDNLQPGKTASCAT